MSIVDAHFHIWRQQDLPWLAGPMQPRIFGPYEAIRRDYPMSEYLADVRPAGVKAAVYVQANWPPDRAEAEVAWVEQIALETGWPHGIVAYADMTIDDARPALDRLARYPRVRGIRQQFHWHENPLYRFAANADLCLAANVRRNIAHLTDYGWCFDLQVFPAQMAGAIDLARACAKVTFVLQHAGMLEDTTEAGWAAWRAAVRTLADQPNVATKLSGFGTFLHRNDREHIARLVRETVGIFGSQRCLFGSNFPIEKLWTDYAALFDAHRSAARALGPVAYDDIFSTTARRIYRL